MRCGEAESEVGDVTTVCSSDEEIVSTIFWLSVCLFQVTISFVSETAEQMFCYIPVMYHVEFFLQVSSNELIFLLLKAVYIYKQGLQNIFLISLIFLP